MVDEKNQNNSCPWNWAFYDWIYAIRGTSSVFRNVCIMTNGHFFFGSRKKNSCAKWKDSVYNRTTQNHAAMFIALKSLLFSLRNQTATNQTTPPFGWLGIRHRVSAPQQNVCRLLRSDNNLYTHIVIWALWRCSFHLQVLINYTKWRWYHGHQRYIIDSASRRVQHLG